MQENVKVFTPEVLVDIFGEIKPKGDFTYKLRIDGISSRELKELAQVNVDYGMDFNIKRSGKGLVVFSQSIDDRRIVVQNAPTKQLFVRDFYENLPQEARIAAFNNTAKNKWDRPADDLKQAILESFYINDSPEGANYWQDVILENSEIKI